MATDLDTLLLQIKVDNKNLNNGINKAQSKIDKFSTNTTKAFAAIAAAATAAFALKGVIDTITKFEKLEASLKTVTGSTEAASRAFSELQDFAARTPFQLTEMVAAFIKLKALGLDPSEEALTSFGNTAVAMGKSLNQMIEAVADAATGEFERLKEFGIRAKSEGDNVTFTFQGVSKTIRKNSEEIQGYLEDIGNVQFAGAMDEQAKTLNVALSNLGDSFDKLVKEIGDSGLTEILTSIALTMRDLIDNTTAFVALGESVGAFWQNMGQSAEAAALDVEIFNQQMRDSVDAILAQGKAKGESAALELEETKAANEKLEDETKRNTEKIKEIRRKGLSDLEKFNEMSYRDQTKTVFGELENITAGVAQHNRALFEANKIAGIANAIISTYEGVTKTLAAYPAPINFALAAGVAAAGFAQVSAIRSTSFGGGGSAAPSLAGSTAAAPVSDVGGGGGGGDSRGVDVSISGIGAEDLFSGNQVRSLIDKINDEIEDGARLESVRVS